MASSQAKTVAAYLKELPPDRRAEIKQVREVVLKNLCKGFVETMNWGMISYKLPLETYSVTYNKQPLMLGALASQKNYISLYLMCCYQEGKMAKQLHDAFEAIGKKPNMGKSCIRFKSADDIPLKEIGKIIRSQTLKKYLAMYEEAKGIK